MINTKIEKQKKIYEGWGYPNEKIALNNEKIFNNKQSANDYIWIYLTEFTLRVTENKDNIEILLSYGFSDFLKFGHAKLITCFIVKYFKEKYPKKEIVFTLDDSSVGGKWEKHGFVNFEGSYELRKKPMKYDFEEGEKICNDFYKKIGFPGFKYYDLTN